MEYRSPEQLNQIKEALQQQKEKVASLQTPVWQADPEIAAALGYDLNNLGAESKREAELITIAYQIGQQRKEDIHAYLQGKQLDMIGVEEAVTGNVDELTQHYHRALADSPELQEAWEYTQKSWALLDKKITDLLETDPQIARALQVYKESLKAWAAGASLNEIEAFFLQNEGFGCQTFMIRGKEGQIVLGHTEEWFDPAKFLHITPEWSTFQLSGLPSDRPMQAFTGYPFALPGSSFNLNNGVLIAADSLNVEVSPFATEKVALPANVGAWVVWYLAGQVEPERIFQALGMVYDGYAFNIVQTLPDRVEAKKYLVARDRFKIQEVGHEPFASCSQGNRINDPELAQAVGRDYERPERASDKRWFDIMSTMHQKILDAWQERAESGQAPDINMLAMRKILGLVPRTWFDLYSKDHPQAAENNDVLAKTGAFAHLFAEVWPGHLPQIQVGSGPVLVGKPLALGK